MRSQCNDFIVAIVVTVIVIVVVAIRWQQGRGLRGRAGKMPGSGELVGVRKMVTTVETGGQVEHQMMKGRMFEYLGVRQRRMAAGPLLSTPERPMEIQHHVAEHVANQQQA